MDPQHSSSLLHRRCLPGEFGPLYRSVFGFSPFGDSPTWVQKCLVLDTGFSAASPAFGRDILEAVLISSSLT